VFRIVLVGDSGVRFDGAELVVVDPGLDKVTAGIRLAAWRSLEARGAGRDDCVRVSRSCVFNGLGRLHPEMRPWLDEQSLAELRARASPSPASNSPMFRRRTSQF
jgi:hypothetical protein